jgi:hypothetical protein
LFDFPEIEKREHTHKNGADLNKKGQNATKIKAKYVRTTQNQSKFGARQKIQAASLCRIAKLTRTKNQTSSTQIRRAARCFAKGAERCAFFAVFAQSVRFGSKWPLFQAR